jgi:hypothetical protein
MASNPMATKDLRSQQTGCHEFVWRYRFAVLLLHRTSSSERGAKRGQKNYRWLNIGRKSIFYRSDDSETDYMNEPFHAETILNSTFGVPAAHSLILKLLDQPVKTHRTGA